MFPENPLQLYGTALETYQGKGQLTLSTKRKIDCLFVAGQLENGKTFMLCATHDSLHFRHFLGATPTLFEGTTHEGFQIEVDQIVSETRYLPEATVTGSYLALRVGHLRVYSRSNYSRRHLTFLLANLDGIHSDISFAYNSLTFTLQPIEKSSQNLERLQVLKSTLPTAQLQVATRAALERVTEAVNELCYLLSIAFGTKIQWVALTESTKAGSLLCRHHYSHITKRYGALYVLDPSDSDVSTFLQCSLDGRFTRARREIGLTEAAIDTYLDAKSEGDFLQVRALKLVVAVEMLKAGYVDKSGAHSLIFPPQEFDGLVPELKAAVKEVLDGGSTAGQRKAVYADPFLLAAASALHRGSHAHAR